MGGEPPPVFCFHACLVDASDDHEREPMTVTTTSASAGMIVSMAGIVDTNKSALR